MGPFQPAGARGFAPRLVGFAVHQRPRLALRCASCRGSPATVRTSTQASWKKKSGWSHLKRTSPVGTMHALSLEPMKARNPADCRWSGVKVGSLAHSRPDAKAARARTCDPNPSVTGAASAVMYSDMQDHPTVAGSSEDSLLLKPWATNALRTASSTLISRKERQDGNVDQGTVRKAPDRNVII